MPHRDGEFHGTKAPLEHLRARARASIVKHPRYYALPSYGDVYVDGAGTVYARSPMSNKFTMVVGQCVPKEF